MRILILGGSGMLGHRLWMNLRKHYETWVTIRGDSDQFPNVPEFPRNYIIRHVDALVFDEVIQALSSVKPDLVINCVGLIKQQTQFANDPIFSISLNALLPHRISLLCKLANIRMIHISTDCVFSGKKGNYVESDPSDATDLYGRTKFLGEVTYPPHTITLRTSIIGRELKTHLGLLEWFLSQNQTVRGFKKAIYTGFTTDELSRIILEYVIPHSELAGLYHVSSEPISKYDLLMLVREAINHPVDVLPEETFECDRSLDSIRFQNTTGYIPPSWHEMVDDLSSTFSFYDRILAK